MPSYLGVYLPTDPGLPGLSAFESRVSDGASSPNTCVASAVAPEAYGLNAVMVCCRSPSGRTHAHSDVAVTTADKRTGAKTRTHRADHRIAPQRLCGHGRPAIGKQPGCAIEPKGHGITVMRVCDSQPWLSLNSPATVGPPGGPFVVEPGSTCSPRVLADPDRSFNFNSDRVATEA